MSEKPNYYAIIPADVRYDNTLKDKAKLLYGEIVALSNKEGVCFASNKYFAELYDVSPTTISLLVKDLLDKGYIESEIIYKEGTKEILHRYLKIIKEGYLRNLKEGIKENLKDNNTSINNTRINIYNYYENVFSRTLNPIEYETMTKWLEDKTEDEIKQAIDETARSNVDNIKYVGKVLYSTKKKNVKPEWFGTNIENKPIDEETQRVFDDLQDFIEVFKK